MVEDDHSNGIQFPYEGLKLMAHCPLCQARYQPNLAKVIAEREDAYLLHVPCPKCRTAVVALVSANVFGVSSVGILTDLAHEEILAAAHGPVAADDVLELYQALRDGSLVKPLTT